MRSEQASNFSAVFLQGNMLVSRAYYSLCRAQTFSPRLFTLQSWRVQT